jgi:hypothetical protein
MKLYIIKRYLSKWRFLDTTFHYTSAQNDAFAELYYSGKDFVTNNTK